MVFVRDTPNEYDVVFYVHVWCCAWDYFVMPSSFEGLGYPQFVPTPGNFVQFVGEVLDYGVDWSEFLPSGDVVVSSSWSGDAGVTLSDMVFSSSLAVVWVSGGVVDYVYRVVNTVTSSGGRTGVAEFQVRIKSL